MRAFFPDATYGEWILERDYTSIPAVPEDWSGLGKIPFEIEDLLLLLRLYQPGDLAFAGVHVETPGSSSRQYPYRAISGLVGRSRRPYRFTQADCSSWRSFEAPLRMSSQWASPWFAVSRRFFLYGGGKEFNPNFAGEVDRVMDYVIALEAAIVPESEFVSRRLRERAVRLLQLNGEEESTGKQLINQMYGIRSTLAHGTALSADQMSILGDREQWWKFEKLVREILISALKKVPSDDLNRGSYLTSLYDISDAERAEKVRQDFGAITNVDERRKLLLNILAREHDVRGKSGPLSSHGIVRLLRKWKWRLKRIIRSGS